MSNGRRKRQSKERAVAAAASVVKGDEDDAARKAVMNVVQVWLDRLQLVSTIVRSMSMLYVCYLC